MRLAPAYRTLALLAAAVTAATLMPAIASGCTSAYHPGETPPPDASDDGATTLDGSASDAATDALTNPCSADLQRDAKNCGRCGHDCFGGTCSAGRCAAVELAAPGGPLTYVVLSPPYVFTSTLTTSTMEPGGIWRVGSSGGAPELFVSFHLAQAMGVLGDKLYFIVQDAPANGVDAQGGFYSCPLASPAPCSPTLVATATFPRGLIIDQGRVLYGDDAPGKGLMAYAPPAAPTVFLPGFGFSPSFVVDGNTLFYTVEFMTTPQQATVLQGFADAGLVERFKYVSAGASPSRLIADQGSLLFTAYDSDMSTGGAVRRLSQNGGVDCSPGGTNLRPAGIYADATRVYWANRGGGTTRPWKGGSIVSCPQPGCCTTPEVLWTGDGEPEGITGDADALYFVTRKGGALWKLAKP
jgi:hypothetical protein